MTMIQKVKAQKKGGLCDYRPRGPGRSLSARKEAPSGSGSGIGRSPMRMNTGVQPGSGVGVGNMTMNMKGNMIVIEIAKDGNPGGGSNFSSRFLGPYGPRRSMWRPDM